MTTTPTTSAATALSKLGVISLDLGITFSDVLEGYSSNTSSLDNTKLANLSTALSAALSSPISVDARLNYSLKQFKKVFNGSCEFNPSLTIPNLQPVFQKIDDLLERAIKNVSFTFQMNETFTDIVPISGNLATVGTTITLPRYGYYEMYASLQSSDGSGNIAITFGMGTEEGTPILPSYTSGTETSITKTQRWVISCPRLSSDNPVLSLNISFVGVINNVYFNLEEK